MGRAVIYTRVSTGKQGDGYSLEVQERDGRSYCAKKGHEVVAVDSDTFSGHDTMLERDGMQAAIRRIRQGEADALVIWRVDRANRFSLDNQLLLRDVSDAGGTFESVTEGVIPNTPMGKLLLSVHSFAGESEWESIRERTQAGLTARVGRGHILVGSVPMYGYRWVGAKKETYEIDEVSGPVVQTIYAKAEQGWSARRIARWLTAQGIPTPSQLLAQRNTLPPTRGVAEEWSVRVVLDILTSPSYTGRHAARRYETVKERVRLDDGRMVTKEYRRLRPAGDAQRVPVTIPALVSDDQWARVQELVASRHWEREETAGTALLSRGFAVCGVCGAPMAPLLRRSRGTRQYMCTRKGSTCTGHGFALTVSQVDDDIWAKVKDIIKDSERFTRLVRGKSEELAEQHAEAVRRAVNTAKELEETRAYADVVYKRMMTETNERIMARHRAELEQLEETVAGLEKRLAEAEGAVDTAKHWQDAHANLLETVKANVARTKSDPERMARWQAACADVNVDPDRVLDILPDVVDEVGWDRETKRDIMRTLSVKVVMYPEKHEWAKANGIRWDFKFSDGTRQMRGAVTSSSSATTPIPRICGAS